MGKIIPRLSHVWDKRVTDIVSMNVSIGYGELDAWIFLMSERFNYSIDRIHKCIPRANLYILRDLHHV